MSFTDPSQSFLSLPFPSDDGVGILPQFPVSSEAQFQQLSHGKPRNCDENPLNPWPSPQMNQRMMPPPNPNLNNGPNNIFFKTRLCSKYMAGMCRNGDNCRFAHGDDDIRRPPNNWQSLVANRADDWITGDWENDEKIIQKMKLCKKFYNGEECPYGHRCNFLHEDPSKFRNDMGRCRQTSSFAVFHRESSAISIEHVDNSSIEYRESSVISIGTTETLVSHDECESKKRKCSDQQESIRTAMMSSDSTRTKPMYWKTKLCTKFQMSGGVCPYGDNCHYAHGIADLQPAGAFAREFGESGTAINAITKLPLIRELPTNNNCSLSGESEMQEEHGKKCLVRKWKFGKKINSIYGDWIDDMPLHNFSQKS